MSTQLFKTLAASALVGVAALTGCNSGSTTSATASELTGSIAQATFPAAITAITVARDDGTTASVPVLDDGTFTALLESGGTYRLLLSADGKGTPVVLDASGGRLRTEIQVTSGGGNVEIGSVRYWDPTIASKGQALQVDTTVTTTTPTCTDGLISGSAQPCAGTTAAVDCSVANDMSNGCPDLGQTDPTAASGATATTSTNDANAALPMGVPVANAPAQIGCASHDHGGPGHGPGGHGHGH
jgi:hypothetical protein